MAALFTSNEYGVTEKPVFTDTVVDFDPFDYTVTNPPLSDDFVWDETRSFSLFGPRIGLFVMTLENNGAPQHATIIADLDTPASFPFTGYRFHSAHNVYDRARATDYVSNIEIDQTTNKIWSNAKGIGNDLQTDCEVTVSLLLNTVDISS